MNKTYTIQSSKIRIFQLEHEDVSRNCFIDYVIYDFPGQVFSASISFYLQFSSLQY